MEEDWKDYYKDICHNEDILFKKRNAKRHIGDIGKIIWIAVW